MPKAFVYGSCVARDTVSSFPEDWEKPTYFARQSMISAANGNANIVGRVELKSQFQARMVNGDLIGSAMSGIKQSLTGHDVMLIDLIDERRGVYHVDGGGYVTHTAELAKSKLIAQQPVKPKLIPFGSEEHWRLWSNGAEKIASEIMNHNVKCMVVAPPWASVSSAGDELLWLNSSVLGMNQKYNRYYDLLKNFGFDIIKVSETEAIGDANHKWGLSPFHYVDSVYTKLREQIFKKLE